MRDIQTKKHLSLASIYSNDQQNMGRSLTEHVLERILLVVFTVHSAQSLASGLLACTKKTPFREAQKKTFASH